MNVPRTARLTVLAACIAAGSLAGACAAEPDRARDAALGNAPDASTRAASPAEAAFALISNGLRQVGRTAADLALDVTTSAFDSAVAGRGLVIGASIQATAAKMCDETPAAQSAADLAMALDEDDATAAKSSARGDEPNEPENNGSGLMPLFF